MTPCFLTLTNPSVSPSLKSSGRKVSQDDLGAVFLITGFGALVRLNAACGFHVNTSSCCRKAAVIDISLHRMRSGTGYGRPLGSDKYLKTATRIATAISDMRGLGGYCPDTSGTRVCARRGSQRGLPRYKQSVS
ncbi:hypothetical protein Bbelb_172280 [Branchiostoma belcheri]|nr:hypothetical protein Bbelb_172280 [Branchiostoma belcheri]